MSVIKIAILAVLLAASLSCCGGQTDSQTVSAGSPTPTDNPTPSTPTLTKYQFTAKVDLKGGTIPFPAAIGDTVTGSFILDPTVLDTYVLTAQGGYVQKPPATAQASIGSITINADLTNWIGYLIEVYDNDPNNGASRDTFSWHVNDTALANSYGLDYIQLAMILDDSTGNAFTSAALPLNLNLNDFGQKVLFISGNKIINNTLNGLWNIRAQITSLDKVQ